MMRTPKWPWWSLLLLTAGMGCNGDSARTNELVQENSALREKLHASEAKILSQDQLLGELRSALQKLTDLGEKRSTSLYYTDRIEIGDLSAGMDLDDQLGDEGVVIYLQLYDQTGDEFKAAGAISVHLLDWANADDPQLIGKYQFDVEQARDNWFGRLLTYHYRLRCPWQELRPTGRELQARVTFTDYLTGNTLQAQKTITITPTPAAN
ncbi:MAG: hypothetical protein HJJLKODD_00173 [Phycisphaerae bacterium]|nr:hypothetical protein [Phycisphaerae bacterium]